jgi:hypothetical protein
MSHPPWLRFQAYVIGLPKTGTTSIARIFSAYRSGHELGTRDLLAAAVPWRLGEIDEHAFWRLSTPRLTRPVLELDAATCHHLYAGLLVQRYPRTVFIHTARDVGGWITSLLGMLQRYRFARRLRDLAMTEHEARYVALMTAGAFDVTQNPRDEDERAVIPLMCYWADHMRELASILPRETGLMVPTPSIAGARDNLARLSRVPPDTLWARGVHANRTPHTLSRLARYDTPAVRAAYDQSCAPIMSRLFPAEHERAFDVPPGGLDWSGHCDRMQAWTTVLHDEEVTAASGRKVEERRR